MVLSQHNPLCGVGPACSPVVIVGGGVSGGYAINRWTEIAPPPTCPCPLMVIGEEAVVSYERPALSKGFLNKNVRPPHFNTCVGSGGTPHDEVYYGKHCVEFITNKKVVKLDVDARTLTLNTGETVSYSAVVLGTGSTAREFDGPGSNLKGVHKLRNLADGLKLVESIEECKKKKGKAVVIGSGFLGVEVASALVSLGINSVTMISKEARSTSHPPILILHLFLMKCCFSASYHDEAASSASCFSLHEALSETWDTVHGF